VLLITTRIRTTLFRVGSMQYVFVLSFGRPAIAGICFYSVES